LTRNFDGLFLLTKRVFFISRYTRTDNMICKFSIAHGNKNKRMCLKATRLESVVHTYTSVKK